MAWRDSKTKYYFPFVKRQIRLAKCGTKTEPMLNIYWIFRYCLLNRLFEGEKVNDYHSHPRHFISFILRGSYSQDVIKADGSQFTERCRWINLVNANDMHNVYDIAPNTWTFMVVWPFGKTKGMTLLSEHGTFWCEDPVLMDRGKEYHLRPAKL
tara:strand:- start:1317 stop:1778 length:462 start_codon:yes stop_codon:yes gene_type:complete